jgi:hypothetical protein
MYLFSENVKTDSGAHPAFCSMSTRSSSSRRGHKVVSNGILRGEGFNYDGLGMYRERKKI